MTDVPDFRDLVGDDVPPAERARLERVHRLLVAAGPPPELPPALAEPGGAEHDDLLAFLPRRRIGAALALAAAIALVAFLGGYLAGHTSEVFPSRFSVPMHGTAVDEQASAKIEVGQVDGSGNWPLKVVVRKLSPLPKGEYYEMFLTVHHKPMASCGTFVVDRKATTVRLNAPYNLREFDGWVVTRERAGNHAHAVVLTT